MYLKLEPLNPADPGSCAELFRVLRNIINEISALEPSDPAKLAKYTICLFQVVAPSNEDLAVRLLEEAYGMARDAHGVSHVCSIQPETGDRTGN